ncbi:MAG: flagellar basal body P-ring formation protein FlgA [Azonexus sp.]|jgi:flagella basal body P-ring formation protein FlgA|nr:flagellar basal body P-ring formation protein FlgA [Azonexus sp.]
MSLRCFFLLLALLLDAVAAVAAADVDVVRDTAERYVRLQTQGMPGQVKITVGQLDVERLPPCSAHEAYTPPGTRFSGQTRIGVRCLGPNVWSVLVPVQIAVTGNYVVTARPLASGQMIQEGDLSVVTGDLSTLPSGIIGSAAEAVGKTLRNSLAAGQPLRADQLAAPLVIRQGQSVRVISRGEGFAVSGEGRALNNASAGQVAQVRMSSGGQTINGIAQIDGTVEVGF